MMLLVGLESDLWSTSAESFYPIRSVVCVGWLIIGQTTAILVRNSFPTTACRRSSFWCGQSS